MPKTATTCIQAHLFGQHSEIEYLGKYPRMGSRTRRPLAPAVQAMKEQLVESGRPKLNNECRRKIAERVAHAMAEGRIPVWSREGHTAGGRKKKQVEAQFFQSVFGRCKVIIFLRRPNKFVESMYLQNLKGYQKRKPRTPVWASHLGPPPRYISIENWLEANWSHNRKALIGHMLCADTADAYAGVFGRDNVRIFVFEQFVENPETVIRKMCQFMGIDGEEGVRLMEDKRANDRWTVEQIERLKALEKSPEDARVYREGDRSVRWQFLGLDEYGRPRQNASKARAVVPSDWLERILQVVRDDHRRLVENWGLPLEQYGYSLGPSPSKFLSRAA
jgi:hypothetical protein